jgi:enterochelin esterase-like enzyme
MMLKPLLLSAALLAALPSYAAQALQVDSGRVERLEQFPSRFIDARNVDVWLPAGYDASAKDKRYKVLYMHDGQMLYDAATTWNKQEWQVDEVLGKLIREGKVPDTIVVGVWNSEKYRHPEYFPQKALDFMPAEARRNITERALGGKPRADDYLRFLVQELKPAIDRKYATRTGRDDTAIMGSSMGGLISLYAISEYPEVFGAAGCVSTHWLGAGPQNAVMPLGFFNYMQARLPDPKTHRIYMDHGDQTIDAYYGVHQAFADILVRERGYDDRHFLSKAYPGTDHSEKSWAARLATPLEFLLGR